MIDAGEINQITAYLDSTLLKRASNHCNENFCSTCGGIAGHIKHNIDKQMLTLIDKVLAEMEPSELYKFGTWKEVVRFLSPQVYEHLLNLKKREIDLNDPKDVNKYLSESRNELSLNNPSFNATVYQGIKLAVKSQDISLVETLILILDEKAMDYPQLIDIAINLSRSDYRLQRVLYNKLRHVSEDVRILIDPV